MLRTQSLSMITDKLHWLVRQYASSREAHFLVPIQDLCNELRRRGYHPYYDPWRQAMIVTREPLELIPPADSENFDA